MTPRDKNNLIRIALHATHTTGVDVSDLGLKAPAGFVWCVRCGQVLSKKRGLSHRLFRCHTTRGVQQNVDGTIALISLEHAEGCQRIIVKRPRVVAPRPKPTPDPLKKLRAKRDGAEVMLTVWDRKLAIAMTKVRQYRALVRRRSAALEAALSEARPVSAGKTRRIEVE